VAIGYAVGDLADHERVILQKGSHDNPKTGILGVVGAGTGLGECWVGYNNKGEQEAFPSEGGHADFAPRSDIEIELAHFLRKELGGRVSIERVVSGPGIVNVYRFLLTKYPGESNAKITEKIKTTKEGAAIIAENYDSDGLCKKAFDIFLSAYGCEVGNAVLRYMPAGGMFVAGGIVSKNISKFSAPNSPFVAALKDKGRLSSTEEQYTVSGVTVEDLGLRGAKLVASRLMQ